MTTSLERQVSVSIPAETISEEVNKRVKKLTATAKINGFRPGKVPESEIRKRFGANVEMDALNELIEKHMIAAIEEAKLNPAVFPQPKFEKPYQPGEAFHFTATVEVFPEIKLMDFSELIIEKPTSAVNESDLDRTLEGMQKQHVTWTEVNRPAKDKDRVWIKFKGTLDGVAFEGGSHDNMPVVLGSNSMIPGFEAGLVNTTAHQDLVIDVTFPENYGAKDLAGKPAQFAIHVHKIEEPTVPELNDEFAQKYTLDGHKKEEASIEKLKEEVRKTLEKQLKGSLQHRIKNEVLQKLYEAYKSTELPQGLVKQESLHLLEQTQKQFAQNMKTASSKLPAFSPEMFEDRAKERIILGLVIREIIKHHDLKAQASKVREIIETIAERFDEPEKAIHYYYSDNKRLKEMESLALEEQVIDAIMAEATIVEKQVSLTELLGSHPTGG